MMKLPRWVADYWKGRYRMFGESAVQAGMTAQMLRAFRWDLRYRRELAQGADG